MEILGVKSDIFDEIRHFFNVIVIVSKVEISLVTSEEERIPAVGGIK